MIKPGRRSPVPASAFGSASVVLKRENAVSSGRSTSCSSPFRSTHPGTRNTGCVNQRRTERLIAGDVLSDAFVEPACRIESACCALQMQCKWLRLCLLESCQLHWGYAVEEGCVAHKPGRTRRRMLRPRPKHLPGDTYLIRVGSPAVRRKLAGSLPIQQQEELRDARSHRWRGAHVVRLCGM
jgi:hypothetical protein